MIVRVLALSKSLLIYWVVNLVLIGLGMALGIFIGLPMAMLFINGTIELLPGWDIVYKSTKFVIFAAFWTGTILWAKEEFFTKK